MPFPDLRPDEVEQGEPVPALHLAAHGAKCWGSFVFAGPTTPSGLLSSGTVGTVRGADGSDGADFGSTWVRHRVPIGDARAGLPVVLSFCRSVCLSVGRSACLPGHVPTCLPVAAGWPSVCLCLCLCPSLSLTLSLSHSLTLCLASAGLDLDVNGAQLVSSPIDEELPGLDFLDQADVLQRYYPHCCELVQALTGASEVYAFDHNVRSRGLKADGAQISGGVCVCVCVCVRVSVRVCVCVHVCVWARARARVAFPASAHLPRARLSSPRGGQATLCKGRPQSSTTTTLWRRHRGGWSSSRREPTAPTARCPEARRWSPRGHWQRPSEAGAGR